MQAGQPPPVDLTHLRGGARVGIMVDAMHADVMPSVASIEGRVSGLESSVATVMARMDERERRTDDRFVNLGETLRRIEAAVTAPTVADSGRDQQLADHARRIADLEHTSSSLSREQTASGARLGTVGSIAKTGAAIGVSIALLLIGLIAFYVSRTGSLPTP